MGDAVYVLFLTLYVISAQTDAQLAKLDGTEHIKLIFLKMKSY